MLQSPKHTKEKMLVSMQESKSQGMKLPKPKQEDISAILYWFNMNATEYVKRKKLKIIIYQKEVQDAICVY